MAIFALYLATNFECDVNPEIDLFSSFAMMGPYALTLDVGAGPSPSHGGHGHTTHEYWRLHRVTLPHLGGNQTIPDRGDPPPSRLVHTPSHVGGCPP
jgi:hypothetical protein